MLRFILFSLLSIQSSSLWANCELELASLLISCEETAAVIKLLPTLHQSITNNSSLRKITQTPVFSKFPSQTKSSLLSSITIEFEFEPFYQDNVVASYVYAICHSSGSRKINWNCSTSVFNEMLTSSRQKIIKFQDAIDINDAKTIVEIIDESRRLWPRKCFYDGTDYSLFYISSVFKNGEVFEVGFCTGESSGKALIIARDMATMTLYEKGVRSVK